MISPGLTRPVRRITVAQPMDVLTKIRIFPTGMRLHEWSAFEEVAVGLMAGSHYNVPYRLESHLPLADIKIEPVGGFGRRLDALLKGEVEAASLLDPQIYMAEELGLRKILGGEFNTLWWVDESSD